MVLIGMVFGSFCFMICIVVCLIMVNVCFVGEYDSAGEGFETYDLESAK